MVELEAALIKERDDKTPRLTGTFEQTISAEAQSGATTVAFVNLTIINSGADTTVRRWRASISVGGTTIDAILVKLPESTMLTMKNGTSVQVRAADAIYEKVASSAIRRGTHISGWIQLQVAVARDLAVSPGNKWRITFEDYLGNVYAAEYTYGGNEDMRQPFYTPGSGS